MSELSPALAAALALTAKHIEPNKVIEPIVATNPLLPTPKVEAKVYHKHISRKALTNRKRNKLAAKSRKRNRR